MLYRPMNDPRRAPLTIALTSMLAACGSAGDSSPSGGQPPTRTPDASTICDGGGQPKICLLEDPVSLQIGDSYVPRGFVAVASDNTEITDQVTISSILTASNEGSNGAGPVPEEHSAVPANIFYFATTPRITYSVTDIAGQTATATQRIKYTHAAESTPVEVFSGNATVSVIEWVNGVSRFFSFTGVVTMLIQKDGNKMTMDVPNWSWDAAANSPAGDGVNFTIPSQRTGSTAYSTIDYEQILGSVQYKRQGTDTLFIDFVTGYDGGNGNSRTEEYRGQLSLVLPTPMETDPALTNNGDGTVSDSDSGLMWVDRTQQSHQSGNWFQAMGLAHETYNNGAVASSLCGDLEWAGFSDWRLPSRSELVTLRHPYLSGYIDTSKFSSSFISWTTDSPTNQNNWAYVINFHSGETYLDRRENSRSAHCVRDQ